MKNKRLTIFLSIFLFFAVIVVLTSTVFSLDNVTVKFLSTTNILTNQEEQIVQSGSFRFGENVFFSNKAKYAKNIEKANPYIRVVNIETVFPNKFVVNAVERNECFVIKFSAGPNKNKYAVTDERMKVLNILDNYQNSTSNGIEIIGTDLGAQNVSLGDFFETDINYFTNLFDSFREWKISYLDIKARVKSIQPNYEKQNRLLVNMRSGVQIIIENSNSQTSDKLNLAFSFYDTKTDKNGNDVDYTKSGIILITENQSKIYGLYKPMNES